MNVFRWLGLLWVAACSGKAVPIGWSPVAAGGLGSAGASTPGSGGSPNAGSGVVSESGGLGFGGRADSGGGGAGVNSGGAGANSGGAGANSGGGGGAPPSSTACVPSPSITGSFDPQWSDVLGQGEVAGAQLDAEGNLIVLGSALGTLEVGGQKFSGPADSTYYSYALKLASDGQVIWERTLPDLSPLVFALDGSDNIYLISRQGLFFGIAELDPQGNTIWSHGLEAFVEPSETQELSPILALSPTGRVAVAGSTLGGKFPGGFLAEYDASGTFLWSLSPGTHVSPGGLAFDANDNVVVAGQFQGSLAWGGSSSNGSGFATKIDSVGTIIWNVPFGEYTSAGVVAVSGNRAYVAGGFSGSLTLGSTAIAAQGLHDQFLASIEDGSPPVASLLARFAGSAPDWIASLVPDRQGGIFAFTLTGDYVEFGSGLTPGSATLLHLDDGGHTIGQASFYASRLLTGESLAADPTGGVYLSGSFEEAVDLGQGMVSVPPGQYQAFLAKLAPNVAQIAVRTCPPPADALLRSSIGSVSNIALAGDVLAFTTGTETMTMPIAGGTPTVQAWAQKHTTALTSDAHSIYWANAGTRQGLEGSGNDGSIVSMPIAGGASTVLADGQTAPTAIAVDDQNVYWTTLGPLVLFSDGSTRASGNGGVWAIPIGGGTPVLLASGLSYPGPLAAGNGTVVFAVSFPGSGSELMKVARSGGAATVIALTEHTIGSIVLDSGTVYWTEDDSPTIDVSRNDGRVRSAALTGGFAATLADQQPGPFGLLLIGDQLYWAAAGGFNNATSENSGGIWRVPAAGGTPAAIVSGLPSVGPFAADEAHLVWGQPGSSSDSWELFTRAR
jgi:hypothetical protein